MLYCPVNERLWDCWIYCDNTAAWMFYIRISENAARHDGVSLAVSEDLIHWREIGPVLEKDADAIWLGTGMVHRVGQRYLMNFSQECPAGRQGIYWAESADMLQWKRTGDVFLPDPAAYASSVNQVTDAVYRWDSIDVVSYRHQYIGFVTASRKGGGGAIGVLQSKDGLHFDCLPPLDIQANFGAYEVPSHVALNGRHYILFSTTDYMSTRNGKTPLGLEGGTYYLVSGSITGHYRLPDGDPLLLGTRGGNNPAMKTVARVLVFKGETLVYYIWGDRESRGWVGIPLLLVEDRPNRLSLQYWQGAEKLKGKPFSLQAYESIRAALPNRLPMGHWNAAANHVSFSCKAGTSGIYAYTGASDGVFAEFNLTLHDGKSAGFVLETCHGARIMASLNYRKQQAEMGMLDDGWMMNLTPVAGIFRPWRLRYNETYRIRVIARKYFLECYINDVYADGYRSDDCLVFDRIGFFSEEASGTIDAIRLWETQI